MAVTPPPGGPGAAAAAPPRPPWRVAVFVLAVVAVVLLTIVLAAAARDRAHGPSATRVISVAAGSVRTVDLQAPPGQLSIEAARTGRVTLSGPVHWTGPSAVIVDGPRLTDGVLHLAYRCAAHSPCTGHLPSSVAYRVSQQVTSGYVNAGIPQASGAGRTITARVDSGEVELLSR